MQTQPQQTPRRGRPPGSNSFEKLRLKDLLAIMGENAIVPVSKVWLKEMGISTDAAPVTLTVAAAAEPKEEAKISFKLETFED